MNKKSKIKMTLTESVNVFRLNKIIGLYSQLRKDFDIFNDNDNGDQYYKTLFPILETYLHGINLINDDIGWRTIEYIPPKIKKSQNDGVKRRLYPKKGIGLVSFPKEIRNYLLHDNKNEPLVVDFDIQNCHPVIYYQFLVKNGYPADKLELFKDYNDNRKNWFDIYGENIKRYILCIINGAQQLSYHAPNNILLSNTDLKKLECLTQEIWNTQDWIQEKYNLEGLTEIKNFIFKKNTEIETQIVNIGMEFADEFSNTENVTSIYAYDGFAVHRRGVFKKTEQVDKFLELLNKKVFHETGYNCVFVVKPLKVNPKLQDFLDNTHIDTPLTRAYDIRLENGQFLSDVITQNIFEDFIEDILVLKSGMGDGKTALGMSCIQRLRAQGKKITTISILNRISLIDNLKHDYPFMYSYREEGAETNRDIHGVGKSVVVCSESLYRLTEATKKQCDYLILDEIMSLLPQMICLDTHGKNLKINQHILLGLIKSVKKIIILDANISPEAIEFIKSVRGENNTKNSQVKQWSVAPRRPRNICFKGSIITKMIDSLTQGNRLFVPCTTSIKNGEGVLRQLQSQFPNKKMIYINAETKGEYSDLLRDTSLWAGYDVVMISPCISTGVSCVLKDAFDEVYCFFSPCSTNPLDASQQIGRVRYPTTNNIYIQIGQNKNNTYRFGARTQDQVLKMIYNNTHNLYKDNSHLVDTDFNYDNFKETLRNTPRTQLFLFNYSEQSRLYTDYTAHLKLALENTYICSFEYDTGLSKLEAVNREGAKEHSLEYLNEKATAIFDSPNLTTEQYERLELKQKRGVEITKAERYTIDKYWLGINTKIQAHGIDEFVENNNKRLPRVLFSVLNSKATAVVKPLNRFIKNLEGTNQDTDNTQYLKKLFDPIKFNLTDFKDQENITTKWLQDTHNGTLLKYIWVEKVLKLFGARHIWDSITLTDEEFNNGFKKFTEWLGEKCIPLNEGITNFNRIMDFFNLTKLIGGQYTLKELQKLTENKKTETGYLRNIINDILRPVGLSFRSERKEKQVKGVRTSTQLTRLQLNYPVLLHYYLEPEPNSYITKKKDHLQLNQDTIPVLISGGIPKMDNVWIELYKSSVFYNLPKIKSLLNDRDEKDQVDKSSDILN